MRTIHACRVLATLFVLLYVMVFLLQFGEAATELEKTRDACLKKFQKAERDSALKIKTNKDGERSLYAGSRICKNLKALEGDDCRCVLQEILRGSQGPLTAKEEQTLEILELLDVNTQLGNKCKIANNLDCSQAAQRVVATFLPNKDTKLQGTVRSRYMACERKAKQLQMASGCTSFMANTAGNDTLLNQCCGEVEASGLDKDCTCLLLENDKASPKAKITRSGKQLIDLLTFVSSNEQIGSTCGRGAVGIGNPDCSGIAKALQLGAVTTPSDLKDPVKCESAAKVAMDPCGVALEGVGGGGLESLVCCSKLEGLSKDDCGCKLGSVSSIDNDLGHFIKRVRSGDELASACPNSSLGSTLNCSGAEVKVVVQKRL